LEGNAAAVTRKVERRLAEFERSLRKMFK